MDIYRIDSTKIQFHPGRVSQWLEGKDEWEKAKKVYPIYWEATTAAACPHRCTFCSTDALEYLPNLADADILVNRMQEAATLGIKSIMFAGSGEPLLHKSINYIVRGAVEAGLDCSFTTNGVLLDKLDCPDLCQWIKVSLNAGSRDNYAKIHRTKPRDWDRVWKNIEQLIDRKGKCALGVQCVVLPENVDEMGDLARMCGEHGVDYLVLKPYSQATFSIVQRDDIDYREMDEWLRNVVRQYSTPSFAVIYRENAMKQESEYHHYDKCRATPFMWMYTRAEGDVSICSAHLMDQRFYVGNINGQTLKEIWEGEKRRQAWEMMKSFDIANCRLNCRMNQTNIYLDQLDHGIEHQNFI